MAESPICELCGHPMPAGEEAFRYHGYSGPCPKEPPPPRPPTPVGWSDTDWIKHLQEQNG